MAPKKSLYERLGGHDTIAAFVTDYITRIRADPQINRFSTSRGTDKQREDLQLNIDYMCKITGGSNHYTGRDMKTAHAGLGITQAEWEASTRHMAEALDKSKVSKKEKAEVLALVADMKVEIVEK